MRKKIIKLLLIFIIIFNLFISIQFSRGYDIYGNEIPSFLDGGAEIVLMFFFIARCSAILNGVFLYGVLKKKYNLITVCYVLLFPIIFLMFIIVFGSDGIRINYDLEAKKYIEIIINIWEIIFNKYMYIILFFLEFTLPVMYIKNGKN